MKKRMLLLVANILFVGIGVLAQDVPADVIVAFKKGSSAELGKYLGNNVEMIILNHSSNVDNIAAESMMNDFFSRNKVNGFNVNHQGKRDESGFVIGTLNTSTGDYRINCYFKKMQSKYLIHQIRIDKTNE